MLNPLPLLLIGWLAIGSAASSQERSRLYTKPDPTSAGGIAGRVTSPASAIEQVLAIPADAPEQVFEGRIEGDDKRSFRFTGLPMRRYDLIIVFENSFYEGLQLERGEDTLTDEDRKKIDDTVQKSEPFFTNKTIHRLEGTTGRGNQARGICTFLRDKKVQATDDFRRTLKLVILKDVGPGWQVVRARDLYPVSISPKATTFNHHFTTTLSGVRVADSIRDLGDLNLTR